MKFSPRFLFAIIIVSIAITGLLLAFNWLNPTPPRKVVMSTGPEGSAYAEFAEQYREYLASNGIKLELRSSGGAVENLYRLNDPNGEVDIAFITMGSPGTESSLQVRSLGAMFFEPLWVFAEEDRSEIIEKLDDMDKRIQNLKVPVAYSNLVYALRMHVGVVRSKLAVAD